MKNRFSEMTNEQILLELGVMRSGHFLLTSGRHSPFYFEKFRILEKPLITSVLCGRIAEMIQSTVKENIDLVCGPATGGMILAFEVARILGLTCVYLEKKGDEFCLLRGMKISEGAKILIVDDVLTTGKSLWAAQKAVMKSGGRIVSKAVMIDRRREKKSDPSIIALHSVKGEDYAPEECPQCALQVPLVNPKTGEVLLRR